MVPQTPKLLHQVPRALPFNCVTGPRVVVLHVLLPVPFVGSRDALLRFEIKLQCFKQT